MPLRRNVTTEDVGNAAAFLLSDLASGMTAGISYVDAGFSEVRLHWFEQGGSVSRERAAEQLRARHLSTIHLLPPEQVTAAVERLEAEAAAAEPPLATVLRWQLLVAHSQP
jgi:hypothetical protein